MTGRDKHHRPLAFHLPSQSHGQGHENKDVMPPKGCMAIRVGHEGEEQRRFVVPVVYLNHPLFGRLLKEAEEEYGFMQQGAITLPCDIDDFRHVQDAIDHETATATASTSHHHHHHQHHHHHHVNLHIPLTGCFKA